MMGAAPGKQSDNEQQNYSTQNGHKQTPQTETVHMDTKETDYPATYNGTQYADDNVSNTSLLGVSAHDDGSDPARQRSKQYP